MPGETPALTKQAMSLKTYRTIRSISYQVQIVVNGVHKHIEFTGGTRSPKLTMPYYKTDNPMIQEALEASPSFNNSFILEKTKDEIKEEDKSNDPELITKEFDNINLAKDFLKGEPYNIPGIKIPNLTSIINKGKGLGFNIVIKKQ
jgi:hypothetical protein